jgi:hypothetical protein
MRAMVPSMERLEQLAPSIEGKALAFTSTEQDVVNALGQTLKRADEKLLRALHNVALEYELRVAA